MNTLLTEDESSRMRVLIAEDDKTSRRILQAMLGKWGYDVVVACDGDEAWEKLKEPDAPKLAVIDWMMPGLDGVEICRRLRGGQEANKGYVYVIIVTSLTEKRSVVAGMEAGADDFLTKPYDPELLRVRVRAGQRIVALHEKLAQKEAELLHQATHDALTGTLNRREVFNRLEAEISRAQRSREPLAAVMVDIDYFKKVNDIYGHKVGDEILCAFTKRLAGALRPSDFLGRYGGEEFLIIAPGACGTPEESLYERLRQSVAGEPMQTSAGMIPITASFGVARVGGDIEVSEWRAKSLNARSKELVAEADGALYEAKKNGRNRVEYSSGDQTS